MRTLIDVVLSDQDREGTSAVLQKWFKSPGDSVSAHEPLAELETDKVVVELAAPATGVLVEILKSEGDALEPGEVLARIDASASLAAGSNSVLTAAGASEQVMPQATVQAAAQPATHAPPVANKRLSPAVRRLLQTHGLDAADITASGEGGRVTAADVERAAAGKPATVPGGSRQVPHDAMRKRIAAHMTQSLLHTAPHVTSVFEADMTAVLAHRARHRDDYERAGTKLTVTAYIIAACAAALQAVPQINSRFHDDYLEIFDDINIGVGTALGDKGLIVPVLRRVQDMSLEQIATALSDLTGRARSGQLGPQDIRGGTFSISNHGVSGSLIATPIIISQPQSAILGVGKLEKRLRVVERDGEDCIQIRSMCYLTLTIDHRALDAHQTNRFLSQLVATLETWKG